MSLIRRNAPTPDCRERDEDLLMYLHNELPALRRRRIALHLRRCAACQARLTELSHVSIAFADAIRGDDLPTWRFPKSPASPWKVGLLPRLPIILLVIVVVFMASTYYNRNSDEAWPGANIVKGIADACDLDIQRAFSHDKK